MLLMTAASMALVPAEQTMAISWTTRPGVKPPIHFWWQTNTQWYHATGWRFGNFTSMPAPMAPTAGAGGYWNTLSGTPVLNPVGAAGFTGYTHNCFTGAWRAFMNGWYVWPF
jgi:hypothetical protein